jgi:hypothetical protein
MLGIVLYMPITWSPVCQMIKHINTGVIRIPLGSLFSNYKLDCITTTSDEIVIRILEKNHTLLNPKPIIIQDNEERPLLS